MIKPMSRCVGLLSAVILTLLSAMVAQTAQPKTASKQDQSQEALVFEMFTEKVQYENDGTASAETTARIRIQSEAGVQQYGLLTFSYASGTGTFDVLYVRVHKPDGSVVDTPAENIQDMAAQITREAPFYSDIHEKHVAVKGLGVGDVLEYQTRERTTKPLAPGQFWTAYNFAHDQVVLDEQLQISVPRDRSVKVKSTTVQPSITESGAYRVYAWHSSNLVHKDESDKRKNIELLWQKVRGRLPQPDVLLSSFATWADVGRWYGDLQRDRVKPSPEVSAKAAELTKAASTDDAKMHALYNYVATQFHYIGVAFGIGRYQPHSAAVVLDNQYGDCKDKHTLLASLLNSVGIPAYPALISTTRDVDPDVPSPGQFDHVVTIVPRDGGLIWLDTTTEIGPYQFLASPFRDKHALAIWDDKAAALVQTPTDLPYPTMQTFNMDAKLSDQGTLEGKAVFTSRGDMEFLLRAAFRSVPLPNWKDLVQRISLSFGFGGDVSEVSATSPEKTDEPFQISYKYTRKDFGDWPNHRIVAPQPLISLPAPAEDDRLPLGSIWLGGPTSIHFHSEVELPAGYSPQLPANIDLKHDYAQFESSYAVNKGKLVSDRTVKVLLREAPASARDEYKQFAKAVQDDYGVFIDLVSASVTPAPAPAGRIPTNPTFDVFNKLPPSSNSEAARLESDGREAARKGDLQTAISSLYRAVAADPKFTRAWVVLGGLLLTQNQPEAGLEAFHKAIASDPNAPMIPKMVGIALMISRKFEDAVSIWQDFIKAHADDIDGPANLANCYMELKRYSEAAAAFDAALKIRSDSPNFQAGLGFAYLRSGERDKASAAFAKLADIDVHGDYLNNVAYEMANADLNLPTALDLATKAVRTREQETENIALANLTVDDLKKTIQLAANWDTLGWINERMSNFPAAEAYLGASWKLTQDGVVAGHLCHLYRRLHETAKAIRMCKLAINRIPMSGNVSLSDYQTELQAARENLRVLTAGAKQLKGEDGSDIAIHERNFKIPRFLPGTESAEFFVLLESDGQANTFKISDVKFISGSPKMKAEGKRLKTVNFNFPAPDKNPARFVRRGILGCYAYTGCSFDLLDPASVHSVN